MKRSNKKGKKGVKKVVDCNQIHEDGHLGPILQMKASLAQFGEGGFEAQEESLHERDLLNETRSTVDEQITLNLVSGDHIKAPIPSILHTIQESSQKK